MTTHPTVSGPAVVVGSGPNGLIGAIRLAQAGLDVTVVERNDHLGGGLHSSRHPLGTIHDHCAAVVPLATASHALASLGIGPDWAGFRCSRYDLAHPFLDGSAAVLHRSLDRTQHDLGPDGTAWRALFGSVLDGWDELSAEVFAPMLHVPRHPLALAHFARTAALPATVVARRFATARARALFAGCAAHAVRPLTELGSAATGLLLVAAGHRGGWPVVAGGTGALADELVALGRSAGVEYRCDDSVDRADRLDRYPVALLDVGARAALRLGGDGVPARIARPLRRFRSGAAAYKLDLVVDGGVPWAAEACHHAATVHVGGSFDEIVEAEAAVHRGRVSSTPLVLVAQPGVADPSRASGSLQPIWLYTHVPLGTDADLSELLIARVEQFAPGLRRRIVSMSTTSPADFEAANPNYVGGDIATGATSLLQLIARPRLSPTPYALGVPGRYLCSAATPPGPGVHGLCGWNAAGLALRQLDR
ncbi:MAG: NAD(P)/FAD-dependent oxidoreductase [Ilumatobacteraceae bacterium]